MSKQSVNTIGSPQFINIQPFNPLISKCEIKVLYLGLNRNQSYIDEVAALKMANSLPGTPIVGAYNKEIKDFEDHGHVIEIENGEITFGCKTVPIGFVSPDARVWFQNFLEEDGETGESVERQYLMTDGYLWTGQFEAAREALKGKGQSMELDPEKVSGEWVDCDKSGMEFFIINDAIFSKLCVLGDDVEPCFEGASVTAPIVSKSFSKDPEFGQTLFTMMKELKKALQSEGGLNNMPNSKKEPQTKIEEYTTPIPENVKSEGVEEMEEEVKKQSNQNISEGEEVQEEETQEETPEPTTPVEEEDPAPVETPADPESTTEEGDNGEGGEDASAASEFAKLTDELNALRAELVELREYKARKEDEEKDALIAKYYMLSDEDKAEVVANKSNFSYSEIEAKLALIYVAKNVDFNAEEEGDEEDSTPVTSFSLDDNSTAGFVSPIQEALRQTVQQNY